MNSLQLVWCVIYVLMNIIGYTVMTTDKRLAKQHRRRVPERRLFTLAALGGGLGSIVAMQRKRHKTKHLSFRIGMPLLLIVNIVTYSYIYTLLK
ncbi:hypothetical protein BVG16_28495 [Paenibacillus selenitireducens]|uniref:DUF1294 domain-containing protein n=1 Tax=Paenibacillus selenitireducens TaxID=1324314 RepID=A0A1T2X1G6_9BACL|nr:DUF1294 domain-containing protein [Paenibacillus selenitireducens]OPA73413.1 hypothetical protein BVG16_28495 [Paenibacillus selenitireducens]